MKTVCTLNKCAGCMACVDICPKGAINIEDNLSFYNAVINEDRCIDCNVCHQICQSNHPSEVISPIEWYQGWSENSEQRKKCSSGGFATGIAKSFIGSGGVVCSCTFEKGEFIFEFAETAEELNKFIGSKYVKSDPSGVYKAVREELKKGQRVLFIGLPCQISAMKNYVGTKLSENLYTIDLICHGTPSPKLLEIFLEQYGLTLSKLKDIKFRTKAKFQLYGDHKSIVTQGVSDKYSIAFLNSLIYTENCYSCPYARKERVSDLTLGDSWGSELAAEEQKRGISLVLCQTAKGREMLNNAELQLKTVDIDKAVASNHQLEHPSVMPKGREKFFNGLKKQKFNFSVFRQLPKQCLKQDIKQILIRTRLFKG